MDERGNPRITEERKDPTRVSRRRFLKTVAATTAGLALASCAGPAPTPTSAPAAKPAAPAGQAPAPKPEVPAAKPAQAAPAAKPAETPKRGGTLRVPILTNAPIPGLDPHVETSGGCVQVNHQIYSKLVRYLVQKQPDGTFKDWFEPDLAESWEHPNETTYVFHLRKGVKFQNVAPVNGRELTADDVVYSIKRIKTPDPQFRYASLLADMTAEATDKYTVRITTEKPNASAMYNLANQMTMIVPREVAETPAIKNKPVGSGPFILKEFSPDQVVRFARNPDYYDADHVYLDAMEFYIIPDKVTRKAAYKSGQLDVAFRQFIESKAEEEEITKAVPDSVLMKEAGGNRYDVWIKVNRPPLDNKKLRQAFLYATDWREFANIILAGDAQRDSYLQWWMTPWTLPAEELKQYEYNLDKAKQLFAESGVASGLTLKAPSTQSYESARMNQILQGQWKKLGVNLEISMMDPNAWMSLVWTGPRGDFDIAAVRRANYGDPDQSLSQWRGGGGDNYAAYANPAVDKLLAEQRLTSSDDEKRKQVIWSAQRLLWEDVPSIPLFTGYNIGARRGYVRNWRQDIDVHTVRWTYSYVWFDK